MVQKRKNTLIRQKEILAAARKLIVKFGSEHVTIKRIAKEIGVTEGAVYRHFKSKREILSFLVDDIERNLVSDISVAQSSNQLSLKVIDSILRNHLSIIEQRRGTSFQVIAEIISLGDKKLNIKVSNVINEYISSLEALMSEGVKAGEIREDTDLKAAATILFGIIQGLVSIWALSNYTFNPEEKYESLWKLFLQSITKQ